MALTWVLRINSKKPPSQFWINKTLKKLGAYIRFFLLFAANNKPKPKTTKTNALLYTNKQSTDY